MAKEATRGARRAASVKSRSSWLSRLTVFLKALGPGIVTGPTDVALRGLATYSQSGAQFGFAMLWTMLFSYPLMAGIQEISAWIGRVTGIGIAGNIRRHYSAWVLFPVVALLLIANVINLGADIGAMGGTLKLLVGGPAHLYSLEFGIVSAITAILVPYRQYAQILKWSALVLLVYVATPFVARVHWASVLAATFIPSISLSTSFLSAL